ncbi:MAG: DUF1566 domain-containing protein [Spartobacteria bacterium]|nr:DUF1566 domain-containing protein [Spartobacteria bacterium]
MEYSVKGLVTMPTVQSPPLAALAFALLCSPFPAIADAPRASAPSALPVATQIVADQERGTDTLAPASFGPVDCPNIGDRCTAHGNIIFAGWHPITHEHLFIPPTDQDIAGDFTLAWKTLTGTDDISPDSTNDGAANHTNRGGSIANFPAFQACEDLSFGGYSDWYLPSQVEAYYLWSVHETIEAGGNITNFQNGYYWSSTEINAYAAWGQVFFDGRQVDPSKGNGHRVRCVRR